MFADVYNIRVYCVYIHTHMTDVRVHVSYSRYNNGGVAFTEGMIVCRAEPSVLSQTASGLGFKI